VSQRRFVALDRDGTLIVERHYLSYPDQVELLPGAAQGLRQLRQLGLGLVIVTNQSGIGRGYFDEAQLTLIHQRLGQPRPGLLQAAAQVWNFVPESCFVIGDKPSDIELGQQVGATTLLVRTGYGAQVATEGTTYPDYIVDDLAEAAKIIETLLP
jgi:D-glycero-D-manno-heptose 1,7-bisphosphate phosphatase